MSRMYVYADIYIYIYIGLYLYLCAYLYRSIPVSMCAYIYMYINTYTCIYIVHKHTHDSFKSALANMTSNSYVKTQTMAHVAWLHMAQNWTLPGCVLDDTFKRFLGRAAIIFEFLCQFFQQFQMFFAKFTHFKFLVPIFDQVLIVCPFLSAFSNFLFHFFDHFNFIALVFSSFVRSHTFYF